MSERLTREESLAIMGFDPQANPDLAEIKKQFRIKAKETHPDPNSCHSAAFIELKNAWDVLSGPKPVSPHGVINNVFADLFSACAFTGEVPTAPHAKASAAQPKEAAFTPDNFPVFLSGIDASLAAKECVMRCQKAIRALQKNTALATPQAAQAILNIVKIFGEEDAPILLLDTVLVYAPNALGHESFCSFLEGIVPGDAPWGSKQDGMCDAAALLLNRNNALVANKRSVAALKAIKEAAPKSRAAAKTLYRAAVNAQQMRKALALRAMPAAPL